MSTNADSRTASQRWFDAFEAFASSRAAVVLMFAWAFAETTAWPVIADAALVPLVAVAARRRAALLAAAIAGMAIGGVTTFAFASIAPDAAGDVLAHVPLVSDSDIAEAGERLRDDGALAFFAQPWSGIPFKVWGVQAGSMDMSPSTAIPAFVGARAFRMTVFASIAWLAGARLHSFLRDYSIYVALAYVIVFGLGVWLVSR